MKDLPTIFLLLGCISVIAWFLWLTYRPMGTTVKQPEQKEWLGNQSSTTAHEAWQKMQRDKLRADLRDYNKRVEDVYLED